MDVVIAYDVGCHRIYYVLAVTLLRYRVQNSSYMEIRVLAIFKL